MGDRDPRHGSAIYDALIKVASPLAARNAAVVVISDGDDDASDHTSDATKSLFLGSSWPPVFGLILDYDKSTRPPYHKDNSAHFRKILAATGGLAIYPSSAPKVPAATEELAATVLSSFALTLQPSRPITSGAKLKLEILGANGKPRRDVNALYPAEVGGCDSRSATPAQK